MLKRIKKILDSFINENVRVTENCNKSIEVLLNDLALQNGRILSELNDQKKSIEKLEEVEFKIFSQWGDDGIIQYLINKLKIDNKIFIEFGVEDYTESNTRFLLMNNNWSGLVMDGSDSNINEIKKSDIYWKYDLTAKKAFITAENINKLISDEGFSGEIGLLHIDIDGNDYWVWKALEVVKPIIMIVEYNSNFGYERPITIPYQADFIWTEAHFSNLYFGSSILSLCDLAEQKGYDFVGCNSAGNNAYFIKKGHLSEIKARPGADGYVKSKFRQSRDKDGILNYLNSDEITVSLKGLSVFNTRTKEAEKI